jgi:hypothetical protein
MLKKSIFTFILLLSNWVNAQPTALFISDEKNSIYQQQLELVSRFYGFSIQNASSDINQLVPNSKVFLFVLTEQSLKNINANSFFNVLSTKFPQIPVIITGLTNELPQEILKSWSQDKIQQIQEIGSNFEGYYQLEKLPLASQLGDLKIPFKNQKVSGFNLKDNSLKSIINLVSKDNKKYPFLVNLSTPTNEIFFQSYLQPSPLNGEPIWRMNLRRFLEISGFMMLAKNYCNDKCWHTENTYANLTIDDPWLVEPYGLLNYKKLLEEMNKANYHTTIGFVPWNFDQYNEKQVIDLFKQNPQRYSLSVHGNNHDHREFYKYKVEKGDPWAAKPLEIQEKNLRQAISRMEQFRAKTGLNYDPVFIFPHEIAPEQTLGLLKKYNFIATFNGGNIPLESKDPIDPLFYFRATSLDFANFTNVDRHGVSEYEEPEIALNLFLGNPILFFEHIILFAEGIDAFNKTAAIVNRLQPNIKWAGLGDIARHLYLQRKLKEDIYEIQMLSSSIQLENKKTFPVTYQLKKAETTLPQVVKNNGQPLEYIHENNELLMTIVLQPRQTTQIDITYPNDLNVKEEDVSKPHFNINFLRWISDFRDITFSGNFIGQYFIRAYYGSDAYQGGFKGLVLMGLGGLVVVILIVWYPIRKYRRSRQRKLT